MNCPKCHSTEINSAGVCLVCGFRTRNVTAPEEPSQEETALHPGTAISAGNRSPSELWNRSEIPPWRLELSKRLREIKLRREAAGELPSAVEPDNVPPSPARTKPRPEEQKPASPGFLGQRKRRTARVSESSPPSAADKAGVQAQVPVPVNRVEESQTPEDTGVPLPAEDVLLRPWNSAPASRDKGDIQKLIDSVMAQQASLERTAPPPIDIEMHPTEIAAAIKEMGGPAPPMTPATPAEEAPSTAPQTEPPASTTEIVAAAPESEIPALDTVAPQMGIAEPQTESAAIAEDAAALRMAMAASLETATPEPEYPALQAETAASPAAMAAALETGTPETEPAAPQAETAAEPPAMAAALETATPEPEYPALQAETAAAPAAMAAALETAMPEPEYPALQAETAAAPAAMAATLETGTPETVPAALQAETAAAPPEIPEPPSEMAAAVPGAAMQAPEIAAPQTKAAVTPTETPAPPTAPEEVARETTTPAPERAAHQEISVAPSKKAAAPPMERAAQAPESPPPPKMIVPPPQTPPPLPKIVAPPPAGEVIAPQGVPPSPRIVAPPTAAAVPSFKIPTPPKETAAPVPKPAIPAAEYSASLAPPAIFSHITSKPQENKLILLSRTLAGLVDLIIIIISGSALIFTVDVLEGIDVFDSVSITHYLMLLLVTYFVYSLFFLSTGTQTMGMMLTDLRLVGTTMKRPKITQILVRCIAFLLGLAAFGVGLLWGFFDRQSRCLHDWLSQTRVERISS